MELSQSMRLSLLMEMYGALLTPKQLSLLKDYIDNNLSISELASVNGSSRQAINDILKRSIALLEDYERKLFLLKKFEAIRRSLENIDSDLSKQNIDKEQVRRNLKKIMENL